MPKSRIMVAVVVGIALLVPSASTAASAPEVQPDLTVKVLSANGSGCPIGSIRPATAELQPNGAVTVRYGNFVVAGGDYRSCVVVVNVATTPGWTYMIPSVENRAWAELDASGSARLATSMWITGFAWTVRDSKQAVGPLSNYWVTSAAPKPPMWAPCGESVNLAVAQTVRVAGTASNTASLITTTLDPPAWRRC